MNCWMLKKSATKKGAERIQKIDDGIMSQQYVLVKGS